MARRRQLRVKMRNSLHGRAIAVPRNVSKFEAAAALRRKLQAHTPVDTTNAMTGWDIKELSNGDMRVTNGVPYIRKLMIDGTSKQEAPGGYNRAIKEARTDILKQGLKAGKEPVKRKQTNFKQRKKAAGF